MADRTQETHYACRAAGFRDGRAQPAGRARGPRHRIVGYRETAARPFPPGRGGVARPFRWSSASASLSPSGSAARPASNDRYGSFAAGLFAGPVTIDSFGASNCVQINFTPLGARRFFGMPMTRTDRPHGRAGRRAWRGRHGAARRARRCAGLGAGASTSPKHSCCESSAGGRDLPRSRLGVRQDRRDRRAREESRRSPEGSAGAANIWRGAFADEIGLGPKSVSRIVRLNRAIAPPREPAMAAGRTSPPIAAMPTRRIWCASSASLPARRRPRRPGRVTFLQSGGAAVCENRHRSREEASVEKNKPRSTGRSPAGEGRDTGCLSCARYSKPTARRRRRYSMSEWWLEPKSDGRARIP